MRSALPEHAFYWRIKYKGITMNIEQHFLIKYGLHNFVTYGLTSGKHIFLIKKMEGRNMIRHAKNLIKECIGETAEIQVV